MITGDYKNITPSVQKNRTTIHKINDTPSAEYLTFANKNSNDYVEFTTKDNSAEKLISDLNEIKSKQGLIGKLWDGFKNLTHIGAGSNKAQNKIEQYKKGEISYEEALEAVNKYKEGQKTCVDIAADMVSGIAAVGAFAAAVPTGGTSLVAGLAIATGAGAGVKVGVKATDAALADREYKGSDLIYDTATGAVNGLFAPVANGVGASVTKTVGKKMGLTVIKEGTNEVVEQAAKQGIKSIVTQQGVDVIGGTIVNRVIATGAGMAVDGAIGGATDNMVRAALNGDNVLEAGLEGAAGGLIMSPVIGGGFKLAGKAGRTINNTITTNKLFKEGMETTFKQGDMGDCALLSMLNGMMKNTDTQDKIKKSITKSVGGDYHVNIGGKTITVAKSQLTDEMLADVSGIKIFEAAYKQLDDIQGGFAQDVAKQFGLNPIHITSDVINDETLDKIASESSAVLSLGSYVENPDGTKVKHYFSIQKVDPKTKTVTVVDPYDTSKAIELSYDEVKLKAISIDGGAKGETTLPTADSDDINPFYGKKKPQADTNPSDNFIKELNSQTGVTKAQFDEMLSKLGESLDMDCVYAKLQAYSIPQDDFIGLYQRLSKEMSPQEAITSVVKAIEVYPKMVESAYFTPYKLSLENVSDIYYKINTYDYSGIQDILFEIDPDMAIHCSEMFTKKEAGKELEAIISMAQQDTYSVLKPEHVADLGIINGEPKKIIFPNSQAAKNMAAVAPDAQALIKSNMITLDLYSIAREQGLLQPEDITFKIKNADGYVTQLSSICDKLDKDGFKSLTTYEIHALTDKFSSMYDKNPDFAKAVNKYIKNNKTNITTIYQYIACMQMKGQKVLSKYNVSISDHALIRMLDRNAVSIFDTTQCRYLEFEEVLEQIAKAAKNSTKEKVQFKIGNTPIELILEGENFDKIRTVILN